VIASAAWHMCRGLEQLTTELTNGQHSCVLLFVPMMDILNIPCDRMSMFSLYMMNFVFHIMLDAVGNMQRVHYKCMKRDVSITQGSKP